MSCGTMSGAWAPGLLRRRVARPGWNAEAGQSAKQARATPEPFCDMQSLPEAALARWRVNDGPVCCTRVEIFADAPHLLVCLCGDTGHFVCEDVSRAEHRGRRRAGQYGRRRQTIARTEQQGEQVGLLRECRELSLLARLAVA